MADKDDDKKGDKGTAKSYKYASLDDFDKGYSELEKKLGEQGKTLGDLKKQGDSAAQALQKYEAWAKDAVPIVEWYSKFQQPISQWWTQFQTGGGNGHGAQSGDMGNAYSQATQLVNASQGADLLTPQERNGLVNATAQHLIQQTLAPWTQKFATTVEEWGNQRAKTMTDQLDQRHKAFSDVLWKTLERIIPQDKIQETRAWHDEALKYADPKNIDPLTLASETLSLRNDKSRLEAQVKEMSDAREKQERSALGSVGEGGGGLFQKTSDLKEMPKGRDERMRNVLSTVKDTVGVEGLREQFPTL